MAQYDVFLNEGLESRASTPYLLDLQADLLSGLHTRLVAPLMRREFLRERIQRLHPEFEIDGEILVLATHLAAAIRRSELRQLKTNLSDRRERIVDAIDVIVTGV